MTSMQDSTKVGGLPATPATEPARPVAVRSTTVQPVYNPVVVAADGEGMQFFGQSLIEHAATFFGYGVTSAAISSGVGVYNSLKAVANTVGADLPMTRTSEIVGDVLGTDGQNYYLEHKPQADLAGFAGSALAGGVGAVSALRALQARGIVTAATASATGLANAEGVLGSSAVAGFRASVLADPLAFTWRTPAFAKAVGVAAAQNVAETLVGEAGVLLLNNQNPIMNPEGLTAWDSSTRAFKDGMWWVVGGAAAGTAIDSLRIFGSARTAFQVFAEEHNALATPMKEAVASYNTPGDRMADALRLSEDLGKRISSGEWNANEANVQVLIDRATRQIDTAVQRAAVQANDAGAAGVEFFDQMQALPTNMDRLAHLGNLLRVELPKTEDIIQGENFLLKTPGIQVAKAPAPTSFAEELQFLKDANRAKLQGNEQLWGYLQDTLSRKSSAMLKEIAQYAQDTNNPALGRVFSAANARMREINSSKAWLPGVKRALQNLEPQGIRVGKHIIPPEHASDLLDAISEVAARLNTVKAGHVTATKLPSVAKMLQEVGAHLSPYSKVEGWYNLRTGKMSTFALPRAQDIGKIIDDVHGIRIEGTPHKFPYSPAAVDARQILMRMAKGDLEDSAGITLPASAQWGATAQRELKYFAHPDWSAANPKYLVDTADLPAMERVATAAERNAKIRLLGDSAAELTPAQLQDLVLERKAAYRAMYQQAGLSEKVIANLLNTGEDFAMGAADAKDGLLMGVLDYSKAENIRVVYKGYGTAEVERAARDASGFAARIEAQTDLEHSASAQIHNSLGVADVELPAENLDLLSTLSASDTTAGFLHGVHSDFGRFREYAVSIGTRVHAMLNKAAQQINAEILGHYTVLSRDEAHGLRAQLALFNNMARRDKYRVLEVVGGTKEFSRVAVRDMEYNSYLEQALKNGMTEEQAIESLSSFGNVRKMVAVGDGGAMALHQDVGAFVDWHMQRNKIYCANDIAAAKAVHSSPDRSPQFYYPPPVNLRRTPHFVFLSPKEGVPDMPSYMLYGSTPEDLRAKVAYAVQKYGDKYRVVDSNEQTLYKKFRGDYEEGKVFNEWDFDENLQRLGKASSAQPSMDINAAETLDLIRNWHHNKVARQIRQGVELKYTATINALRSAKEATDFAEAGGTLAQRFNKLNVYEDTRRVMLDRPTYESSLAGQTWFKVQDFAAQKLSAALDSTAYAISAGWSKLRGKKGFGLEDFDKMTQELEAAGFKNPYDSVGQLLTRSEVISDGRSLSQATRVLNSLVASTTLRLDPLNSLLQVVTTPILSLGTIREAKRALAGTKAGEQLLEMTTVTHPVTGLREPTAAKLLANAVKQYFTDSGKEFAAQLARRGILSDLESQFRDASDFSSLNGRHTLMDVQNSIDKWTTLLSKYTAHQHAENMSRFMIAHALKEVGELRGMQGEELYSMIENGVNKVHGIHRKNLRVQMFNGPIGQSIGLFQSYVFNYAQWMMRTVANGAGKDAAIALAMQSSLFGVRSVPGFSVLNHQIAKSNSGMVDLYTMAGTDADPHGAGAYLLYGAVPADLYTRGDMTPRQVSVVPLDPTQWATYTIFLKAGANLIRTATGAAAGMLHGDPGAVGNALSYGLAHNGLSRPLQGLGTVLNGNVTTNQGTPMFLHSNWEGYNPAQGFNYMALGARILGGRPRDEAILMDSYYRRTAYQTEIRKRVMDVGASMRNALLSGNAMTESELSGFMNKYAAAGGQLENFNQFFGQQLTAANSSSVKQFRDKLQKDGPFSRAYNAMKAERSSITPWEEDAALQRVSDAGAAE